MISEPTQRRLPMHTTKSSRSFDVENPEATARPSSCPWKSSPTPHSSVGSPTQDSNCVVAPRSRVASWILDSNPDHVTNHRSKTAVPLYRQATRASIRNPERFGWNPERFGLIAPKSNGALRSKIHLSKSKEADDPGQIRSMGAESRRTLSRIQVWACAMDLSLKSRAYA